MSDFFDQYDQNFQTDMEEVNGVFASIKSPYEESIAGHNQSSSGNTPTHNIGHNCPESCSVGDERLSCQLHCEYRDGHSHWFVIAFALARVGTSY